MAVTLRDVGRRAGVSAMTVSRVINGRAAAPARNGTPTKGRWGGHPQDRKNEIASRVTAAISELAQLPKQAIWVVFEDVAAEDWYIGAEPVSELKKRAAQK